MANLDNICWFTMLLFISCKSAKSTKIFLIDIPKTPDASTHSYDDYGSGDYFSYDYIENRDEPYETTMPKIGQIIDNLGKTIQLTENQKTPKTTEEKVCQRLFKSIYGGTAQKMKCIAYLQKKKTLKDSKENESQTLLTNDDNQAGRKQDNVPLLGRFSHDYFDIGDLARSRFFDFAQDYIDLSDYRRKSGLSIDDGKKTKRHVKIRATSTDSSDSSSSTSESQESNKSRKPQKKTNRFKVISNDEMSSSDDSDSDSDSVAPLKSAEIDIENGLSVSDSDFSSGSDLSEDVVTKKPIKISKSKNNAIKYLQGNKVYDNSDFRKSARLPYFLPKRIKWDEDDLPKLGYYWFNGPSG